MANISRLQCYLLWKGVYKERPGPLMEGLPFPCSKEAWVQKKGKICPICQDHHEIYHEGKLIYCICEMLEWLDKEENKVEDYEVAVPYANIDDIKPYVIRGYEGCEEETRTLLTYLHKWVETPDRWMFIQGGTGTGKTTLLYALKTALGRMAYYTTSSRFQQFLFASLNTNREENSTQRLIDIMSTVPILLFDDWGMEHDNEFTTDTLSGIIDRRYSFADEFITVVTTNEEIGKNLISKNLPKRRIASRLADAHISNVFRLTQPDLRNPDVALKVVGGVK